MAKMWNIELGSLLVPTVSTMILFIFTINIFKYFVGEQHIQIQGVSKKHNWKVIKKTTKPYYCSICKSLLLHLDGHICDSCRVCADHGCVKSADKLLKCKEITYSGKEPMGHHWVKGNLPLVAICNVCKEECDLEPGLVDVYCCWCQRCAHESCKEKINKVCDFGEFKLMIIPPASLEVSNRPSKIQKQVKLRSIISPEWPNWNPLIVVANTKSGNNDGAEVLSWFRRLLNPAQVVDLTERGPVAALEWCRLLGDKPCNVLVAGGDGTIAWLLNAIQKLGLKPIPSVSILPLGTGNDLSRVMGWGEELDPDLAPETILRQIQTAEKVELDRWSITVTPTVVNLGFRASNQQYFMYNYMSIGVDAQVALNFHRTRQSRFYLFSHRIFNKLLYLCFGTQQAVERECKDLDKRLQVYLDGEKMDLPPMEGIVILNIPFWAAGVDVWNVGFEGEDCPEERPSISDGKLEVFCLYSSFHIAQLSVGLSKPHRLGQAKTIKIKLCEQYATQIDGEPYMQQPCVFEIKHCNRASMLKNVDFSSGNS